MRNLTKPIAMLSAAFAALAGVQAADQYYAGQAKVSLYNGIAGTAVGDLTGNSRYPNQPSEVRFVTEADAGSGIGDNYGGRIEFLWTAPFTGPVHFAIAADDNAQLWVSSDESPANLAQVAREPEWNGNRAFGTADRRGGCPDGVGGSAGCPNVSPAINVQQGRRYLMVGLWKEGSGGDNYAIAYKRPADLPFADGDTPIPGSEIGVVSSDRVNAYGATASRSYAYDGDTVQLSASLYVPPGATGTIKWFKDGVEIAGATGATYDFAIGAADTGTGSKTYKFKASITAAGNTAETPEVSVTAIKKTTPVLSPGFVTAEFFHDIGGTAVQGLLDDPKYQANTPDATRVLNALNTPDGYGENYGARIAGFILPQESGQYRFFIRSDDASQLYLNTTAGGPAPVPGSDTPIAEETGCCNAFTEPDSPRTSEPISLTAGQRYAFVALVKEAGGGDFLQVAWRKEGDSTPAGSLQPMSGPIIGGLALADGFSVAIAQQPQSPPDVIEGRSARLTVAATVTPDQSLVFYQWKLNGNPIPGANRAEYLTPKTLAIGTYNYTVDAYTVGDKKVTSQTAAVKVVADTFPPVPKLGVVKKGTKLEIGVGFDEEVKPEAASQQANYSVSPGTIESFRFVKQSGHAVITVTGVPAGQNVTVTVRNVEDLKGNKIPTAGATATAKLESKFAWVGVGGDEANAQKSTTAFSDDAVALSEQDFDLVSGGTAHWTNYDEQTFVYEEITGDFDRKVRVEFQSASSQWARAGLQVREALDEGVTRDQLWNADTNPTGTKMSQNFTIRVNPAVGAPNGDGTSVPGNNSYELVHRPRAGFNYDGFNAIYNILSGFGGAPPYPNAWMRLKREGQTIRAWKSSDGTNWEGGANVTYVDDPATDEDERLSDKLYVGIFYAPEFANNDILTLDKLTESAVAKFREYGAVGGGGAPRLLSITSSGGNVTITYEGTLQSADVVTGPFSDVTGATSPYSSPASAAQRYFRSRGN